MSEGEARAQTAAEIPGTVLSIDEEDIVVDLGMSKGGTEGSVVELWRPFKLRHPVTGKILVDRFRIGRLKLVQVQRTLAWARPVGDLARAPAEGDVVVLPVDAVAVAKTGLAKTQAPQLAPATTTPEGKGNDGERGDASDPEARELSAIFDALKGQPPAARILRYEQHARSHPGSKYARVLYEEAAYLRRLFATKGDGSESVPKEPSPRAAIRAPEWALAATPLTMGIEMPGASGAVLHMRHAGEMAYRSYPMRGAGAGYFRAAVPAEQMKSPEVEFFVESTNAAGVATPVVASAESPDRIEVHDAPRPEPPAKTDATVALFTDFADYNRLHRNDYSWQTEGYFGLRYHDVGVRAVRSGFGVYRGVGGSLEELDVIGSPRAQGRAYLRLPGRRVRRHHLHRAHRASRARAHQRRSDRRRPAVRSPRQRQGHQHLARRRGPRRHRPQGDRRAPVEHHPRVPIVIRTEVTNQPAGTAPRQSIADGTTSTSNGSLTGGDIGARAMVQVGYRFVPSVTLAVRGSYEGRTIQHAGPGAGLGVTYTW